MNQNKDLYSIPLQMLKEGVFDKVFKISKEFLDEQKMEGVFDANLNVNVHLSKQTDMYMLLLQMRGAITIACDRCLEEFSLPIKMEQNILVKTRETDDELADAENVMLISPDTMEIELSQSIYEMIMLSIPLKKVHAKEKDCNQSMLSYLKHTESSKKEEKSTDPRWDSLYKLKEKLKK